MPIPRAALADEARLVDLARSEPDAFGALYDHYFPRVYNFVRYRVADPDTVDDLTAKVFERVLAYLPRYRAGAVPFAVWLFRIARNIVNDHYRHENRRKCLPLEDLPDRAAEEPGPAERVEERETCGELLTAIGRLDERAQELLALKFTAGLTNRQIAKVTGLSESNVGVTLFRIIRRLRAELEGGEDNV